MTPELLWYSFNTSSHMTKRWAQGAPTVLPPRALHVTPKTSANHTCNNS